MLDAVLIRVLSHGETLYSTWALWAARYSRARVYTSMGQSKLRWHATARRALGDLQFKVGGKDVVECTPEMRRVELQAGDSALVLASDGLWDVLGDSEVVAVLARVRAHAA